MAAFTDFSNVLPDPNNKIGDAGQVDSSGGAGPGFASVSISSEAPIMQQRTNSGRLVSRSEAGHKFSVSITYNPLTRAEFEPVYSFLLQKRGRLEPFFISLPQNRVPQDTDFATWNRPTTESVGGVAGLGRTARAEHVAQDAGTFVVGQSYKIVTAGNTSFTAIGAADNNVDTVFTATGVGSGTGTAKPTYSPVGQDTILMGSNNTYDQSSHGLPKPGDFFTVSDNSDTLHTKMYRVVRVESQVDYQTGLQPATVGTAELARLHISPALQRNLYDNAALVFHDPKMRVVMSSDVQEYKVNTKNLYSFSLKLEEAQK